MVSVCAKLTWPMKYLNLNVRSSESLYSTVVTLSSRPVVAESSHCYVSASFSRPVVLKFLHCFLTASLKSTSILQNKTRLNDVLLSRNLAVRSTHCEGSLVLRKQGSILKFLISCLNSKPDKFIWTTQKKGLDI